MKGDANMPWIIVAFIIAIIVLFVLGGMVVSGQKTADNQFTQTDLWNCCDNCWATNPGGAIRNSVSCSTSGGESTTLQQLYRDVRGDQTAAISNCGDIGPFCKGD